MGHLWVQSDIRETIPRGYSIHVGLQHARYIWRRGKQIIITLGVKLFTAARG